MAAKLQDLKAGVVLRGLVSSGSATVVGVENIVPGTVNLTYRLPSGRNDSQLVSSDMCDRLDIVETKSGRSFGADGRLFKLVAEAMRIRNAYLFDPVIAVRTSMIEPLPHQITAVYESMLPRQPLRFLLADDPGAGKTIMAGLLIKELMVRGDVERCLVVCPGSLAEQWQQELADKFQLHFDVLSNDALRGSAGNYFVERSLVIARLDKLSRDEETQALLKAPDCRWDLVVCDEAHKMSATYSGSEIKFTKRYKLGQLLSTLTRHFLLMTATPHNGKEADFQLFMALLDRDRFEGRFRDGVHRVDVSDLMRRMVKERLLRFDGTPLFPERRAYTRSFVLTPVESRLYEAVTAYVREEFNRAEALSGRRVRAVGFALTLLQRRLASSPRAILRSLQRREKKLQEHLADFEDRRRSGFDTRAESTDFDEEFLENLEDAPESEREITEQQILDEATAALTEDELRAELDTLQTLVALANEVQQAKKDAKWVAMAKLLQEIRDPDGDYGARDLRKLVIFTEHRDTLDYLHSKIQTIVGRPDAICIIHGGVDRLERLRIQESFRNDPAVQILLATDAAGEGINLQRAHLMVNYDLPWNPNRLEQRFGRIHRIGQREVCHLFNLVSTDTREGEVYKTLLVKLDQARESLGGQVFDVLGEMDFEGLSLRDLLLEAVRYGDQPEVKQRLSTAVGDALDTDRIEALITESALAPDTMDMSRLLAVREEMERAQLRRLQPHFVEDYFVQAFKELGGSIHRRTQGQHKISYVPAAIRKQAQRRHPVATRYRRIAFDTQHASENSGVEFVACGHPLLDGVTDLILHRHKNVFDEGTILIDETDPGKEPRLMVCFEHVIQDGSDAESGGSRVASRKMLYVDVGTSGPQPCGKYAPYLDYRALAADDPDRELILGHRLVASLRDSSELKAMGYVVTKLVPKHQEEVETARLELIAKTRAAVRDRLSKEINHWDLRASELREKERAGRPGARLNSSEARRRADELQERLSSRMTELDQQKDIRSMLPRVVTSSLIVPLGLKSELQGKDSPVGTNELANRMKVAAEAREIVMQKERELGCDPKDVELEKLGYDIESKHSEEGRLRFLEVKGRREDATTITVTRNEILFALNSPEQFILAIVLFGAEGNYSVHYLKQPFQRQPDAGAASVNYELKDLLKRSCPPHL